MIFGGGGGGQLKNAPVSVNITNSKTSKSIIFFIGWKEISVKLLQQTLELDRMMRRKLKPIL